MALDLALDLALARALALDLDLDRDLDLALALALDLARARARDRALDLDLDLARALDLALARARDRDLDRDLDRDELLGERQSNAEKKPSKVWVCDVLGESREALNQRAQRMFVICCYAFAGYDMSCTEHEAYINEAEGEGYREKNPLVDIAWHLYHFALDFEHPNMERVKAIGERMVNSGDKEIDGLFNTLGFKEFGKGLLDLAQPPLTPP